MAGFVFKLEPVLRQRQAAEDQCQRELAELLRHRLILETQLRSLQSTLVTDKRQLADSLTGRVDIGHVRRHAAHAGQLTGRAQQLAVKLLALHRQIDTARAALLDAARERKAIELLRDRELERWRAEQSRREARALDELGTQRYVRVQGVGS